MVNVTMVRNLWDPLESYTVFDRDGRARDIVFCWTTGAWISSATGRKFSSSQDAAEATVGADTLLPSGDRSSAPR